MIDEQLDMPIIIASASTLISEAMIGWTFVDGLSMTIIACSYIYQDELTSELGRLTEFENIDDGGRA
jgi:hypothetical protein